MRFTVIAFLLLTIGACIKVKEEYKIIAPGIWRGVLELQPPVAKADLDELEEASLTVNGDGVFLPFLFEIKYVDETNWYVEIINGSERIIIDHVTTGRNPYTGRDTVCIYFDLFDSYLSGELNEGILVGKWVRNNRQNYQIPFVAHFGEDNLFPLPIDTPKVNFTGKWESYFEIETDHPYASIGLFEQNKEQLTGTFMTETGDYRFLAGAVHGYELNLSVFDGAHAFLFKGKYQNDSTILGTFWSGHKYKTLWNGKKNPTFELGHPDSLTHISGTDSWQDLSFIDLNSQPISLKDESLQGKVKILQIMGTWCPNCLDETKFLIEFLKTHQYPNLRVIGLAFESYAETEKNIERLNIYQKKLKMPYPLWYAGNYKKSEASKVLPMLNEVSAFPTMIFLDEENHVQRIHTGFNGPATPKYAHFKEQFELNVQALTSK